MSHVPLLVGGSGRSGTTLLSKLLSTHPIFTKVPETRFLVDPGGVYDFIDRSKNWTPYSADKAVNDFIAVLDKTKSYSSLSHLIAKLEIKYLKRFPIKISNAYSTLNIEEYSPNFNQFVTELKDELIQFRYSMSWVGQNRFHQKRLSYVGGKEGEVLLIIRKFLDKYFEDVCKHQGVQRYFEKNTWNILHMTNIFNIWPKAKLVVIHRHPYDVIKSFTEQSWMPKDPRQSAVIYVDIMNKFFSDRLRYLNAIHEIKLEGLVENPSSTIEGVYEFYGVDQADQSWKSVEIHSGRVSRPKDSKLIESIKNTSGLYDVITKLGYGG